MQETDEGTAGVAATFPQLSYESASKNGKRLKAGVSSPMALTARVMTHNVAFPVCM